jgi:peptidyl-prolyl cis-trans isomerase SurA
MSARRYIAATRLGQAVCAAVLWAGMAQMNAQPTPVAPGQPITLDRVVAIVNSDLILESDVDAERRYEAFQPLSSTKQSTQDELIKRLIDRDLILQQIAVEPQIPMSEQEVDEEMAALRKTIPKCAAYHCETDAGWQKFVTDQGFTLEELRLHWKLRMEVLRFIEERFRMGIRITQEEIDDYYNKTLIPAYQAQNAQVPAEKTIQDRIQEILLQQQVDKLLDDWLTTLRAQGSVRVLKPGEGAP